MRRQILFCIICIFALLPYVQAAELAPQETSERKFQRGLLNTVFSPVEISHSLEQVKTKDEWVPTWLTALMGGSVSALIRATTGIYEIVTAPIPSPPKYQPIYHPEFSLEHLGLLKEKE